MLKFASVSAALAAIVSIQVNSSLLTSPKNSASQWAQASTSNLVVTDATANPHNAFTNTQAPIVLTALSTTLGVKEKVDPAARIILGLAVVGGAIGVALSTRNANSPLKSSSEFSSKSTENTIRIDQASRDLQKKLLRLLHDERDTANRLLSQVKINNPNRSINWCVEKVIYDLERDRGGY